jgi:hypothetical protein
VINAEIRFATLWRFGGVADLEAASVSGSFRRCTIASWTASPAVGIRFFMDTYIVRLDVSFGSESTGLYLHFGQLF